MKYFIGKKRKNNYFEGWYFKHSSDNFDIAFIPSIIMNKKGEKKALIQVITNEFSEAFYFDFTEFLALEKELFIKIGNNVFSKEGLRVNLVNDKYNITGELIYTSFKRIKPIMGVFSYIPFMQCYHDIISMNHQASGVITINDKRYILTKSASYIEKDAGRQFPSKYIWVQANHFNKEIFFSLSLANIPFLGFSFRGLISSLIIKNKEYRFTTYNRGKIISINPNQLILKKGKYQLEVVFIPKTNFPLLAPLEGEMSRIIYESIDGRCKVKLYRKERVILEDESTNAGIEIMMS